MKYSHNSNGSGKAVKIVVGVVIALVAVAIVAWLLVQGWYKQNLEPLNPSGSEQVFVIEPGTSTKEVAENLASADLIKNSTAFLWYISRNFSDEVIKAGTYRLSPAMPVPDIANTIVGGKVDTSLITIPPGLRLDQIKTILTNAGFSKVKVDEAFKASYNNTILRNKPASADLEGYIYPESFQITADTTPHGLVQQALSQFDKQLDQKILDGLREQGLSLHEGIILASIVQEEVSDLQTQRKVAQVFLKRLELGMPLGADPTFRFAAAKLGVEEAVDIDSPYNTRIYAGLPPGPIANFHIDALVAVSNPADTDFLYFVSGDDGITRFSKTEQEHQDNVDKYCKKLCQL